MPTKPDTTQGEDEPTRSWRDTHTITDWEFAEIGKLLCDHHSRDLALMVVRLQRQLEVYETLRETSVTFSPTRALAVFRGEAIDNG